MVKKKGVGEFSKEVKAKKNAVKKATRATQNKINLTVKYLILFLIFFIITLVLKNVAGKVIYENFFFITAVIFGFVSIAFLIALLALIFLKKMNK